MAAAALFLIGVVVVVWATERFLDGLVGLAAAASLSTFAVGAILSGFEAENVAVGLAAGAKGAAEVALGTVFGGAVFLVCLALGLGALLYPLEVRLPRSILVTTAATPVAAGIALLDERTPRWSGVVLLVAFAAAMAHLVLLSRRPGPMGLAGTSAADEQRSATSSVALTILGLAAVAVGGEMVARGATGLTSAMGLSAGLVGMVLTPAAIELEEVIRQAIPAREGHPEVSAGNLVGTLFYFVLFNLGLISLLTPVSVETRVRSVEWPFLIGVTWLAVLFLARGRVGRPEGAVLLSAYGVYALLHASGG